MSQVITRFAPSPTGYLHIGGARTALFCWLYARHHGGQFRLRIEDTDKARSTQDAIDKIMEGLDWLGLDIDGDIVSQSAQADRHVAVVNQLLESGNAYRCYCSQEELEAMREKARAEKRPMRYDGTWRDRDDADAPDGVPFVVRFKAPLDGETVIKDQVQGDVTIANKELDDLILLRSDGTPTYMLAVVVDDYDMGITHVIRGDDHLTNAARQINIYKALGWDVPVFAHVPLIHGPDGAKFSKRHGALGVEAYRDMGYMPEAMRNYLVRLGWSHGDDEIFSTQQAIDWFDLKDIGKSAARFDFAKLENLNGNYIREADDDRLTADTVALLKQDATVSDEVAAQIRILMPELKPRAKTLLALADGCRFLLATRPLGYDEKATKLLTDDARAMLGRLHDALEGDSAWTLESVDEAVRAFAEAEDLKLGKVAQPLRAALTGTTQSPGIFDILVVLGRQESLARIKDSAAV